MADIPQDFPIQATPDRVFEAVSNPAPLDQWWTLYLRILRRHLEHGESVPYDERLEV